MENIQLFQYNDTSMEFEVINGEVFANATIMCQAFGKRPNDFLNLISTKNYVEAVTKKTGNANLIEIRQGGFNQGTWIHEKLILKIAQWLDVNFEVWCDEKVAELLKNGIVAIEIKPTMSIEEVMIQQLQGMIEAKKQIEEVRQHQALQDSKINLLEARTTTRPDVFTVAGYARLNKLEASLKICAKIGGQASRICKERGYVIDKCEDPRFGTVNMYPRKVLVEVFDSFVL